MIFDLVVAIPLIIGVVEAIKRASLLKKRFVPVLSIALGMLFFALWGELDLVFNLLTGLIAGLSASGLWSGVKATVTG